MDYLGFLAFCISFGWIPIAVAITLIFELIAQLTDLLHSKTHKPRSGWKG